MYALREYNESHNSDFLEEVIVHPDGSVTGSWNKKSLVIYKPESKEGNEYIPCKGENCSHPCPRYERYQKEAERYLKAMESLRENNLLPAVDSCTAQYPVSSCS